VIIFHDSRSAEYGMPGHPERPERVVKSAELLRKRHANWEWRTPNGATTEALLRAHSSEHIENVRNPAGDFDADSPAHPGIFEHATRAAGAAIDVAREALGGRGGFSLMRPPGHHATRDRAMGFCYFSNIAVAALDALEHGAERVAVWDFDAHHGNGTEDVVAADPRIAFASIHQFPGYPGTGTKSFRNVTNFPVPPLCPRSTHMRAIKQALEILLKFQPDLLLVSAGFDAYVGDPITEMTLEVDDFATFGTWLRESGVRAGAILEGGYSDDLPELMDAFLTGWQSNSKTPCG
jgi:acetoin utilization deacetylase AcuC-like enzyme